MSACLGAIFSSCSVYLHASHVCPSGGFEVEGRASSYRRSVTSVDFLQVTNERWSEGWVYTYLEWSAETNVRVSSTLPSVHRGPSTVGLAAAEGI